MSRPVVPVTHATVSVAGSRAHDESDAPRQYPFCDLTRMICGDHPKTAGYWRAGRLPKCSSANLVSIVNRCTDVFVRLSDTDATALPILYASATCAAPRPT